MQLTNGEKLCLVAIVLAVSASLWMAAGMHRLKTENQALTLRNRSLTQEVIRLHWQMSPTNTTR